MTGEPLTRSRLEPSLRAAAAFVVALAGAGVGLITMVHSDRVAALWLANAGVVALLIPARRRSRWAMAPAAFAGLLIANLANGSTLPVALALAAINIVEIVIAVLLAERWAGPRPDCTQARQLGLVLAAAALVAPALSATLAAVTLGWLQGAPPAILWLHWFLADSLGMATLAPPLLTLDWRARRALLAPGGPIETVLIVALAGIVTALVFSQQPRPLLFLVLPILSLAAFRLRFAGAGLALATVTIVATALTCTGHGPIAFHFAEDTARLLFLQMYIATCMVSVLPVATALAHRWRLTQALVQGEERFRTLSETAPVGIFRTDPLGRLIQTNAAWRSICGFAETPAAQPWLATLHSSDPGATAAWSRAALAQETFARDMAIVRPDGSSRWIGCALTPERDAAGRTTGWVGSLVDITARREAEQSARAASLRMEESLRLLTMAERIAGVGHWRFDTTSRALFWSDEVYRIHGRRIGDTPGLTEGISAYHPDDRAMVSAYVDAALADGVPWTFRARLLRPDGEVRHVTSLGQPERGPSGRITGVFGIFQDITDRVEAEEVLIQARDAAEAAVRAKSAFLAAMSHEIRTPMTGVLGMIELLRMDDRPEERARYFDALEQSASVLMTVLNDLLDYSKIEGGALTLEEIDFDIVDLVRKTAGLFEHQAASKAVALSVLAPAGKARVRGDPVRLQQIVSNLVSNAVKFTAEGEVTLRLRAPGKDDKHWRIEVSDTGIGLSDEARRHLFQPFMQADASTTRRFGGTGLGLAICRRLVEAMGGTIRVSSEIGLGSTFEVLLPFEKARPARVRSGRPALDQVAGANTAARPLSVLLAEDNPVNTTLVTAILETAGHRVTSVGDGVAAVEAAGVQRFDAIVMDMQMPLMDGLAATRAIREGHGPNARTAIVALTADAAPERRAIYRDAGLDAFLSKPVRAEELLQCVAGLQPAAPAPFDAATLAELRQAVGTEGMQRLLAMLVVELDTRPAEIAGHLDAGRLEDARRSAHSLKGAASSVGAVAVAEAARMLETIADGDDTSDARAALERVCAEAADETRSLAARSSGDEAGDRP